GEWRPRRPGCNERGAAAELHMAEGEGPGRERQVAPVEDRELSMGAGGRGPRAGTRRDVDLARPAGHRRQRAEGLDQRQRGRPRRTTAGHARSLLRVLASTEKTLEALPIWTVSAAITVPSARMTSLPRRSLAPGSFTPTLALTL